MWHAKGVNGTPRAVCVHCLVELERNVEMNTQEQQPPPLLLCVCVCFPGDRLLLLLLLFLGTQVLLILLFLLPCVCDKTPLFYPDSEGFCRRVDDDNDKMSSECDAQFSCRTRRCIVYRTRRTAGVATAIQNDRARVLVLSCWPFLKCNIMELYLTVLKIIWGKILLSYVGKTQNIV